MHVEEKSYLAAAGGHDNVGALMHMLECRGQKQSSGQPECLTDEVRHALIESTDAVLDDAMYAYLKARTSNLNTLICEAFISALAAKGDAHVPTLLGPAAAASLKGGNGTPEGRAPRGPATDAYGAGVADVLVRLKSAPDAAAFLSEYYLPDSGVLDYCAAHRLASDYTVGQLQSLLADDRCAAFRGVIYSAIVSCRARDAEVAR